MGYLLGLPSKKLDMIIYYERYVVIQPGVAKNAEGEPLQKMDFLTEEEYLDIMDSLPQENASRWNQHGGLRLENANITRSANIFAATS